MINQFRNKTGIAALSAVIIGLGSIASVQGSASAADAQLPRGDFPACTTAVTTYCITSVTFVERGVEKIGVWVPTGTAINDADATPTTKTSPPCHTPAAGHTTVSQSQHVNTTGCMSLHALPMISLIHSC
jgi:hypothetical protein